MFGGLTSLEKVDLSGIDASSITSLNSMFKGLSSLKSVNLSGMDISSVKI